MAQSRGNALINTAVDLHMYFRLNGVLTDPYNISKVEILDTNGSTILETLTGANINHPSTGTYYVTATGSNLDSIGTYYDKWYFTRESGDSEETLTNDFYVSSATAGSGTLTGAQMRTQVAKNLRRNDKTTEIAEWMKSAIQHIYHKMRFQGMESKATFTTTADDDDYVFDTEIVDNSGHNIHQIVKVFLSNESESTPIPIKSKLYCDYYYRDPDNNTQQPDVCYIWNRTLYFRNTPDDAYDIVCHTLVRPPYVQDDETFLLHGLDMALIALTTSNGFYALDNPQEAAMWYNKFIVEFENVVIGDVKPMDRQMGIFQTNRPRAMDNQEDPWYGRVYGPRT